MERKREKMAEYRACAGIAFALAMAIVIPQSAFAMEESSAGVASDNISVTVPTSIPCTMLADGTVVAPSDLSIANSGDTVVVDTYTEDAMGNKVDFTLDIGGTRALSRIDGKDKPVASPIRLNAGSNEPLSLSVSKLSRAEHASLIDAAVEGTTAMFRLGFSFDTTSLTDKVAIDIEGTPDVGSTLTAIVTGVPSHAQMSYQWYRKKTDSMQVHRYHSDNLIEDTIYFEVSEPGDFIIKVCGETYFPQEGNVLVSNGNVIPYLSVEHHGESQGDYITKCEYTYTYKLNPGTYTMKVDTDWYPVWRTADIWQVVNNEIDEAIDGATGSTYEIQSSDEGYSIYCKAMDASGNYIGELVSEMVGPVGGAKDKVSSAVHTEEEQSKAPNVIDVFEGRTVDE